MSAALEAIHQICTEIARKVDRRHVADAGRRNEMPEQLWDAWVQTGLLGVGLPEEYGGIGGDLTDLCHAIDWLAQEGLHLPTAVANFMSRICLTKHGTDEQRMRILPD